MIESDIASPIPPSPPDFLRNVRQSAPRPLPALFAIALLVGTMLLVSMMMDTSTAQEGTATVAAEANFDSLPQ